MADDADVTKDQESADTDTDTEESKTPPPTEEKTERTESESKARKPSRAVSKTEIVPDVPADSEDKVSDDKTPEDEEPFDKGRALKTIQKLREFEKQAKEQARRLADYEKREREAEEAAMSERDRLAAQLKRAEAELKFAQESARDTQNHHEVERLATRLNIVDPEAAVKLLDWGSLDYDDDGRPQDVEKALKTLIHDKPYLLKDAGRTSNTSTGNPATRSSAPGQRMYTMAEINDYQFYSKNREDIKRAYTEGRIIE